MGCKGARAGRARRDDSGGRILIVGVGGIGCPAALALARAGRTIGLADPDVVDPSNLHRQILFDENDVGRLKVAVAARRLDEAAPGVVVEAYAERFDLGNGERMLDGFDVVIDGSDDVRTKFMVSDAAVRLGVPAIVGGALRLEGTLVSVVPGRGACYRCLFEEAPDAEDLPTCAQAGILGPVAGVIGGLAAAAAEEALERRLEPGIAVYDAPSDAVRRIEAPARPDCPACGLSRPPLADLPGNSRSSPPAEACGPAAAERPSAGAGAGGLSAYEIERFGRQVLLREIGGAGQRRIRAASVEVPGGGAAAEVERVYLRAAGVGSVAGPDRSPGVALDPASVVAGCRAAVARILAIVLA